MREITFEIIRNYQLWLLPNVAWAIDTTEWERDAEEHRLYAHGVQDLCSRYHFEPWMGRRNWGTDAATWLDNHRSRPCLQGRIACAVQFGGTALRLPLRERQAIFISILKDFREMISQ